MSAELIAILAVGVSQTLLMVTLAGFLLANQRRLEGRITELARSQAALDQDLRAHIAKELAGSRVAFHQDLQAAVAKLDQDLRATIAKLDRDLRERLAQLDADLRERIARLEGLIEGLRDTMTAQRGNRPDAA